MCAYMKVRIKLEPAAGDFQVTSHTLRSKFQSVAPSCCDTVMFSSIFCTLEDHFGTLKILLKFYHFDVRCPSISLQVLPSTRRFGKLVETAWRAFQTLSQTNEFKLLDLTRGIKCIENTKNKTRFEITTTLDNFGEQCY